MFRVGSLALLLALTATLPPAQRLAAQEDLLETVSAIEQSLWQGWADRDATAFREHIVDNHVQIGGGGITAASPAAATTDPDFNAPQNDTIGGQVVWWVDTSAVGAVGGNNGTRDKTDMILYSRSDFTATAASCGVSAFARTLSLRYLSASRMISPKGPVSFGSTVSTWPG